MRNLSEKGQLSPVLMRVGRKGVLSSTMEVPGWNAVEIVMRTWDEDGQVGRDMQGSLLLTRRSRRTTNRC